MSQHPESIAGLAAALGAIAAGNTAYLRYKKVTSQR
jgi:hypothetical protein